MIYKRRSLSKRSRYINQLIVESSESIVDSHNEHNKKSTQTGRVEATSRSLFSLFRNYLFVACIQRFEEDTLSNPNSPISHVDFLTGTHTIIFTCPSSFGGSNCRELNWSHQIFGFHCGVTEQQNVELSLSNINFGLSCLEFIGTDIGNVFLCHEIGINNYFAIFVFLVSVLGLPCEFDTDDFSLFLTIVGFVRESFHKCVSIICTESEFVT